MNIQLQRNKLIQQILTINDIDLLKTIKSLLDYSAKKETVFEIPQWQQEHVMKRLEELKQNPNITINRKELNNRIKAFTRK